MTLINSDQTPRELGFRMPAEWEQQTSVWFQWPHKHPVSSAANDLSYQMKMEKTWMLICWEIHRQVRLDILVHDDAQRSHIFAAMNYYGFNMTRVSIHITETIDVWHRDTGPIFVVDGERYRSDFCRRWRGWDRRNRLELQRLGQLPAMGRGRGPYCTNGGGNPEFASVRSTPGERGRRDRSQR
jgi:agmatine deiminase